jgi:hypothetical protein
VLILHDTIHELQTKNGWHVVIENIFEKTNDKVKWPFCSK